MNCKDCLDYDKSLGGCHRASSGKIGEIDEVSCLLKLQISLLRTILYEMEELNSNFGNGEEWKEKDNE